MSEGCSTSACNEVQDPNHRDSLPDYANLSENFKHHPFRDENEVEEENKELHEEEDEEEDVDFNPSLKENNSVEASSSLSSEVEDLDTDVADSREKSCTAFDRDSMEKERDNIRDSQTSENVDHGEDAVAVQTTVSPASTVYKESVVITPSENEFLCDKENVSAIQPMVDMDDVEGAICMRTRARYSLASFTLDELETFLQESDDEDDLQNVDDEEEYRKFLSGVLRGDDSENLIGNANVDEEDEENDADFEFEFELEEALESEPEEVEERRMTRRIRCQKSSLERSKKLSRKSNRPLRPLLPFPAIGSFPAYDGNHIMPNMAPSYMPHVNNGATCAFTPHQIGQLHCLIHEHVQLLIQVFSLSVLEPGRSNTAAKVKELVVDMRKKHDQALTWRTVPHPSFCFFPPYVHPSVPDGLQRILPPKGSNGNVQREISASSNRDMHADAVSLSSGRNMHLPDDQAGSFQTQECPLWVPYVCGPKLSVVDVAPLRLVENFIDDISSAVRAYERHQIELGFESGCQKEPLFPLHNFPCSAGSDDQGEMENNPPDSSGVPCSSPIKQMTRKTMAANLLEKAKNQPVASVPKVIARVAQRFWPFFNPALYPHKPPPAAIVNRVLFTDAEDELLALGLMEYNTDWKAIQQRFLPCKSRHQIFVRQKNRASSKTPENPIKAVRRMKNSPLTSEEISLIEMGIKRFKLDWVSIWTSFVPYRDPSLLPRQWRIACGTQKSYISDPNKNAKRCLNNIRRRTSRAAPSTRHSSSEKEGDSTDNAIEDPNSADNRIDKEDKAYVHEAFLADWRPGDNNVSSSIPTCMPTHAGSIQSPIRSKYPAALSSQVVLRPYRSRKPNSARLVKLAPGLPPVNLPPSVRVMSQSAFKSSQAEPSLKTAANASRIADLAGSSVKSGPSRSHPVNIQPTHSDLQMHPLLFQAPQDGRLSYYQANGNTSTPSSFAFFPGKQPQLSLGSFHNPLHIRDAMYFLSKSSIPPGENASSPYGADFHPLLQRTDDVDTHSVGATPACPIAESRQGCTLIQDCKKDKELELDIHLSSTSKNPKAAGNRCETGRLRSAEDSGKKRVSGRDGISDELNSGDIPRVMPRNKGSKKASDATRDESFPEIIMEQEELSDSEDEFGENVEFECEEMADSEGESMSDSEQIVTIPNEEVQQAEMGADIVDDALVPKTRNDYEGNNTCSTSGGLSTGLEPAGKGGANLKTNVSSLNLNSGPPISPLPNPKNVKSGYDFGPFGTAVMFSQNQQVPASSKGSSGRIKLESRRNPRKRICRSNSNPSPVAGSGKGKPKPNIDTEKNG